MAQTLFDHPDHPSTHDLAPHHDKNHHHHHQHPVQDGAVVQADLEVDGRRWQVTCVSMGNPHALIYSSGDGQQIKVHPRVRASLPTSCLMLLTSTRGHGPGQSLLW